MILKNLGKFESLLIREIMGSLIKPDNKDKIANDFTVVTKMTTESICCE